MKLYKTALWALLLISSPLAVHAAYGDNAKNADCHYDGGLWLGVNYGSILGSRWALMGGYSGEWFLVDLGYSFVYVDPDGAASQNSYENEVVAHLGARSRYENTNLFGTYGVVGSYRFLHPDTGVNNPWEAGVFIGLDYQCTEHFMIQAKISPYTYQRDLSDDQIHNVFSRGNVVFAYVY